MNFEQLIQTIEQTHDYLLEKSVAAINQSLTIRNWLYGCYIVEYEQKGEDRARYGEKLLKNISEKLTRKGIKGMSVTSLKLFRQFYQVYPQIGQSLTDQFIPHPISEKIKGTISVTGTPEIIGASPELLITSLSFTHIVELIQVEEPLKRAFYEIESIRGNWSVRELQRQKGSLLYERTGLSKNKEKLLQLTHDESIALTPNDIIKDPYVFEFLGLKQKEVIKETDLEKLLLDHIHEFLLELGKGFCFEARQKRFTIDNEHYNVDLMFYHRILKCHVLIDLKIRKFKHKDVGQMNYYLNYLKDNEMSEGDNPPIGIILCSEKGASTVKYATGSIDNQMFISQYLVALPTEEELKALMEKEQRLLGE